MLRRRQSHGSLHSQPALLSLSAYTHRLTRRCAAGQDADVKDDAAAEEKAAYKKDDFFDELSRESREGGPGRSWLSEQRKLDMETFGMVRPLHPTHADSCDVTCHTGALRNAGMMLTHAVQQSLHLRLLAARVIPRLQWVRA